MGAMSPIDSPHDSGSPSSIGLTSTSLLEKVKTQDQEAWRKLVNLYGPLVYGWCRRWGVQPSDASDIVQEVFQAAATAIGGFSKTRAGDSFRGWLWTIARHEACNHFTRLAQQPQVVGGTELQARLAEIPEGYDGDPNSAEFQAETTGLTQRALNIIQGDFEERTWRAFWRTTIDGQPSAMVGNELGMTKRAARQAKHRVLQRLREEFQHLID